MTLLRSSDQIDILEDSGELNRPIFATANDIDSISTSSEDGDFPVNNLLNPMTYSRWQSEDTGSDVTIDITIDGDCNYVAFAVHELSGYDIKVEAYVPDSPSQFHEIFPQTTIDSNLPLIIEFVQADYEVVRVTIIGNGTRKAAVMYAGKLLRFSRGVKVDQDVATIYDSLKPDLINGFSESGNFLGRLVRNEIRETKLQFSQIDPDEISDVRNWFRESAPTNPFFVCWQPEELEFDVGYCWFTEQPVIAKSPVTGRYSTTMTFRGFA